MKRAKIKRVAHETLREKVYGEVREALMAGKFKPGEAVRLQAVADAVGTSLMPVREALRRLVAERALVSGANRTTIVPFPTKQAFYDVLETRLRLEPFAASLAAEKITPRQFDTVSRIARRMEETISTADFLRLNQQFHFTIYHASERPIMLSLIESLWLHTGPLLSHLLASDVNFQPGQRNLKEVTERHREILLGLSQRDAAAAHAAVAEDISAAGETIMKMLHDIEVETDLGENAAADAGAAYAVEKELGKEGCI